MDPEARFEGSGSFELRVEEAEAGQRLDAWLHGRLLGHSRTFVKDLILRGAVSVDSGPAKPSLRLRGGEAVVAVIPSVRPGAPLEAQEIPLRILFEDDSLIVLDKPAGLVVHPGSGRRDGTLANALAFHSQALSDVGGGERPGIVHRLDRETSGVMVVAKSNRAHFGLAAQFQGRTTKKSYLAIVEGEVEFDADMIQAPLARSRQDPTRVVVDTRSGKEAETTYEVLERFTGFTFVRCRPKTGRTHQIRVHLAHIGHPILCDPVYGRRRTLLSGELARKRGPGGEETVLLDRHALHAESLGFLHPLLSTPMRWESPVPEDLNRTLEALRLHRSTPEPTRKHP